jgi:anaerobic ribonucleoside-triphosphate reductase activating protein
MRAVVWVQGCRRRCPGCGNAAFQPFGGGEQVSVDEAWRKIEAARPVDGVTFSGGEPFEQAAALAELARRAHAAALTVVVYTGYTLEELRQAQGRGKRGTAKQGKEGKSRIDCGAEGGPDWRWGVRQLLAETDLLIDGPYVSELACAEPLRASSNQRLHFLTGRILPAEVEPVPVFEAIISGGEVVLTGQPPLTLW